MKDSFHNIYARNYWHKRNQKRKDAIAAADENALFISDGTCPITGLPTRDHNTETVMGKKYCNVFATIIKQTLNRRK